MIYPSAAKLPLFQFRPAARPSSAAISEFGVSIHAPAARFESGRNPSKFQFAPAARLQKPFCIGDRPVSIHAPAAATQHLPGLGSLVSVHAPARQNPPSTPVAGHVSSHTPASHWRGGWPSSCSFQFTRPRGARQDLAIDCVSTSRVSIHAPARGATRFFPCCGRLQWFQFTRPRGARP